MKGLLHPVAWRKFALVLGAVFFTGIFMRNLEAAELQRLEMDEMKARSAAVVLDDATLVHTAQLLPDDANGKVIGPGDALKQAEAVFDTLEKVLQAAQSGREAVVKLNIYVAKDEVTPAVQTVIRKRFGKDLPAVAYVRGVLPQAEALIALDAVAVSTSKTAVVEPGQVAGVYPATGGTHFTLLPAGRKAYVSGLAGQGTTMAAAMDDTLRQLWLTLDYLKAEPSQIVQFKVFLNPMTEQKAVIAEIKKRFPTGLLPVVNLVEWTSPSPVEIEMIVSLPSATDLPVVDYLTPPGEKASPVFSRVVRVNGGKEVYLSGLFGDATKVGEQQIKAIFAELKHLAELTGSDLRHLVKATYYVASDETNRRLATIRTEYFDPASPPAASKASVRGTGWVGRMVTLDMIAVTKE